MRLINERRRFSFSLFKFLVFFFFLILSHLSQSTLFFEREFLSLFFLLCASRHFFIFLFFLFSFPRWYFCIFLLWTSLIFFIYSYSSPSRLPSSKVNYFFFFFPGFLFFICYTFLSPWISSRWLSFSSSSFILFIPLPPHPLPSKENLFYLSFSSFIFPFSLLLLLSSRLYLLSLLWTSRIPLFLLFPSHSFFPFLFSSFSLSVTSSFLSSIFLLLLLRRVLLLLFFMTLSLILRTDSNWSLCITGTAVSVW